MAPIFTLLFFALFLSITGIMFPDSLKTFTNQKLNNCFILIPVQVLSFFLIPFTFTSAIVLLLTHVAVPQSAYIKHLTMATKVLLSAVLFIGTPLVVHMALGDDAVTLYNVKFMLIGTTAAVIYKYDLFNRCINYARQTAQSLVLVLCMSASTFLLIGSFYSFSDLNRGSTLVPIPIGFLFLSMNYLNFLLAMVLLLIRISVPAVPAVHIDYLVKAVVLTSFTIVLIGFCMIVELLNEFM